MKDEAYTKKLVFSLLLEVQEILVFNNKKIPTCQETIKNKTKVTI